ncbi:MAG: ChpI protein [Kiritimatiellia bacterium]|nr:ChpI protein [Kiritimatiellia bacterium]
MKTAISIPDNIFKMAERFASERRLSRSALFTEAVAEFLVHHRHKGVTEELNRVYAGRNSGVEPMRARLQAITLPKEEW